MTTLTLGPVTFAGFEIPEQIIFGGQQRLAVHLLPGGGRVVDVLGADAAPIRWDGVFAGQDAGSRVRKLERFRKLGLPLLLNWDSWRFLVVIESFEAEASSRHWIPYRIRLCVLPGPEDIIIDYLSVAVPPVLTAAALGGAALDGAIASAETAVTGAGVASALGAAGTLAQYVTMRAFAGG